MSNQPIKFIPSEKSEWLIKRSHTAFILLCIIASKARRACESKDGLEIGEAYIGDWKSYGMSEQNYRTAKKILCQLNIIKIVETNRTRKRSTTGLTTEGTKVKLLDSVIWDINYEETNDRTNDCLTTENPLVKPMPEKRLTNDRTNDEALFFASLKKESEKEKSCSNIIYISGPSDEKSPAIRSLPVKKDELEGLLIYCQAHNLPIEEKDLKTWLRKYGCEKITTNLTLLLKRNQSFSIRLMEAALKEDYAGESERILINRNLAMNYQKQMQWNSLIITQKYCRCEVTGNSLMFKLHPDSFKETLIRMYERQNENFG